jgi:malonyl-CoA decarboxylase
MLDCASSSPGPVPPPHLSRVAKYCHALLSDYRHPLASEPAQPSQKRLATEALAAYESLTGAELDAFFDLLTDGFPRRELFRRLNLGPRGATALVEMRRRLLRGAVEHPSWAVVEADIAYLLRSWFDPGCLEFRRIDGRTSPAVLQSLIKYEAVHEIRDWRDLSRRLEADRRCFGLFHPALPDEPVIFMELALTSEVSARVQTLLDPDAPVQDPANCRCAMFYSISSCHEGLRGVPFGNALIARAVDALQRELPGLNTFATISPVPGFRPWLTAMARDGDRANPVYALLVSKLEAADWSENSAETVELEKALVPLCAFYLLHIKRGQEPADSVARFHLGNGARLERLNWLSDTSAAGIHRSAGLTANYLYRLSEMRQNQQAYVTDRKVIASRRLQSLARVSS